MKSIQLAAALSLACALPACTTPDYSSGSAAPSDAAQASIPFADQRSAVLSWQPDGQEGLWVQDGSRQWYYADLIGPCIGLPNTVRVGFETGATNRLDRFSHVVIPCERERCAFSSFTKVDAPPNGKRHTLDGDEVK
jgi:hypothetical protein